MTKLTYYTSFDDLKASKSTIDADRSQSTQQSELREFFTLLKDHCISQSSSKLNDPHNPSKSEK
jgi:hypothetical protein